MKVGKVEWEMLDGMIREELEGCQETENEEGYNLALQVFKTIIWAREMIEHMENKVQGREKVELKQAKLAYQLVDIGLQRNQIREAEELSFQGTLRIIGIQGDMVRRGAWENPPVILI